MVTKGTYTEVSIKNGSILDCVSACRCDLECVVVGTSVNSTHSHCFFYPMGRVSKILISSENTNLFALRYKAKNYKCASSLSALNKTFKPQLNSKDSYTFQPFLLGNGSWIYNIVPV
ncbi:unnamed protein product [Caenorhabditis auriculariae]|uniref:PAN-3 domain-containing protein n=1 Tax=Caenorhabditis auriculariae TaxID=2777116 RepID=A0A8S1HUA5_9PELO|nr:unnamed protein product [Caenorhabditis auriculariae]